MTTGMRELRSVIKRTRAGAAPDLGQSPDQAVAGNRRLTAREALVGAGVHHHGADIAAARIGDDAGGDVGDRGFRHDLEQAAQLAGCRRTA